MCSYSFVMVSNGIYVYVEEFVKARKATKYRNLDNGAES